MSTLPAVTLRFDGACLRRTRRVLRHAARERGLDGARLDDFLLAVDEGVVTFTTGPEGTTVRLSMRLPAPAAADRRRPVALPAEALRPSRGRPPALRHADANEIA